MKTAFTSSSLLTPLDSILNPFLIAEDGIILDVGSQDEKPVPGADKHYDFGDAILAPGFIDIHIHGGGGHDVMAEDPHALLAVEEFLAQHGVTSYFPTTVTSPWETLLKSLRRLGAVINQSCNDDHGKSELRDSDRGVRPGKNRACPLGIHLEGPFISGARCGIHNREQLLLPTLQRFEALWEASAGTISMMTIAPELEGAEDVIREARRREVIISLGHSDATAGETYAASAWGATHATHTFNAMRLLHHREPGIAGVVLSNAEVSADIIADGIHVAPEMLKVFLECKGPDSAILISDAISGAGMPEGRYLLGDMEVEVARGECRQQGKLAGSLLTLDAAVRNVVSMAKWNLQAAICLATLNPAMVVGIGDRKGVLAPGRDADIVVLSPQGHVLQTFVGGKGF